MATTEQNSELTIEVSGNLDTLRADVKKDKSITTYAGEEITSSLHDSLTQKEESRDMLTLAKSMDTARRSGMAMQKSFESISKDIRKVGEAVNSSGKQLEAFSYLQKAMYNTQAQKAFISNLEEIQRLTGSTKKEIEQLFTRIDDLKEKGTSDKATGTSDEAKSAIDGAKKALQAYTDEANYMAKSTESVVSKTLNGLEDALFTFATKGKWHFSDLASSALNDIARIGIHQGISGVFSSLFDGLFGSSRGTSASATGEAKNQGKRSLEETDQLGSSVDSSQAKKSFERSTGAVDGAKKALHDYAGEAKKVAEDTEKAVSKTLNGLEDALVTFVSTGKWHFSDLANSIIADFARIAIHQSVSGVFSSLFGGLFGNSGSSGFAGSANVFSGGSWSGAFSYDSFMPSPFSSTSLSGFSPTSLAQYSDNLSFSPTALPFASGIDLMNEAGAEALMPLTRTGRDYLTVQNVGNDDAFSKVNVNVVVNNNSSSNVATQQSQDSQGNMTLEVIVQEVDRMLSNNIIQGTSKIGSAMDKTRGLSRARTLYNR